jgi:hypothetical protein
MPCKTGRLADLQQLGRERCARLRDVVHCPLPREPNERRAPYSAYAGRRLWPPSHMWRIINGVTIGQ